MVLVLPRELLFPLIERGAFFPSNGLGLGYFSGRLYWQVYVSPEQGEFVSMISCHGFVSGDFFMTLEFT
jgi:hypothetical protein